MQIVSFWKTLFVSFWRSCPTVCAIVPDRGYLRRGSGRRSRPTRKRLRRRQLLEICADSHTSGVSMKGQSTDCSRARFWISSVCLENGNAYPGTLRKGSVEACMGSSEKNQNKPAQVFDCPVRISLTEKGDLCPSSYLCVIQRP